MSVNDIIKSGNTPSQIWRKDTLGNITNLTLSSVDKKTQLNEQEVQLCNYTDVYYNHFIRSSMDFMLATATEREISNCSLSVGDVVITKDSEKYNDIGVPAIVRDDIPNLVCGYHLAILRPLPHKVDGMFLFYALSILETQQQFWARANGITRFGLRKNDIKNIEIMLPSISEQKAIANVLTTLDDKIELNRQMNKTLEEIARTLFESWFVDFDPVRAKMDGRWQPGQSLPGLPAELYDLFPDRLVPSELGEIPEGWSKKTLDNIAHNLTDKENPIQSPDILFKHFSIPAYDKDCKPRLEPGKDIKSIKTILPPSVVLLSRLNPENDRVWLVDLNEGDRAVCSTEFLVLKPKAMFSTAYIYCLARSAKFRQKLQSLVTGTSKSHQRAQMKYVMSIDTIIPTDSILQQFQKLTSVLFDRILANRRETSTLAELRDELLPKLLSGEIRMDPDWKSDDDRPDQ